MITLGIPNESRSGDQRVALTPDAMKRLSRVGIKVLLESGAGLEAGFDDKAYEGAAVAADANELWSTSDVVAMVGAPTPGDVERMKRGAVLIGMLAPLQNPEIVNACVSAAVTAMAYELVPRITRAQAVDVLSAMSSLAGYKGVLLGATHLPRQFPMMMTAAGTINASKVFIIGAGVAGLQAIATAKRLGAVVEAYDLRPAVKEQVESLGARFIEFQIEKKEGQGGYAAAQSESEQQQQRQQMHNVVIGADVVITTAAVPGRPAPKLIDEDMVRGMNRGSVIVDLAAETGGNCTLTEPGRIVTRHHVTIIGLTGLPATIPYHASQMLSRILTTLLGTIADKQGNLTLNFEDEVVAGMTVTHDGEIVSPRVRQALGLSAVATATQGAAT
ncbi:MAG: Re/Si-specific NAD(P)(+) transhydrogenase subunit alpha [Phycisphaerales bacterium]|nr:Re/Si-specific NAD(P)(+) transhydrogenase subunit alpha [Phycisphaerales bacterium]